MSSSTHGSSAKAIFYAFSANLGIAIAKSLAALFTSSGSMLAEAIHSFADCGNQVLLYFGLRQSTRPADEEHPLGYGKASYFWSFIVAILLFTMGGLFSIYEGLHKLEAPEPLNHAWVGLLVLAASFGLEYLSLKGCLAEITRLRGDKPLVHWLKNTRNAELVVVLGEDSAALIGLALAFVFVLMALVTSDPTYDAMGSICIGTVLLVISAFIAWRIKGLIVGRSADPELRRAIDAVIREDDSIDTLLNSITMQLGPGIMLAVKIRMVRGITIDQAVARINALERRIKEQVPEVEWCFVEPDVCD